METKDDGRNKALGTLRRILGLTQGQLAVIVGVSKSLIESAENGRRRLTPENQKLFEITLGVMAENLAPGNDGHLEVCKSDRTYWVCEHPGEKREDWTFTKHDYELHQHYIDLLADYRDEVVIMRAELTLAAARESPDAIQKIRRAMVREDLLADLKRTYERRALRLYWAEAWRSPRMQKKAAQLLQVRRKVQKEVDQWFEQIIEEKRIRSGLPESYAWHAPQGSSACPAPEGPPVESEAKSTKTLVGGDIKT